MLLNKFSKIHIPASVRFIGISAFGSNEQLSMITIDPQNSFYYVADNLIIYDIMNTTVIQCSYQVKSIELPQTITEIGYAAFHCPFLEEIVLPFSVSKLHFKAFVECRMLKTVKILGNLLNAENHSFCDCNELDTIYYYGIERVKIELFSNNPSKIFVCESYKGSKFATLDITLRSGVCPYINIVKRCTPQRRMKSLHFALNVI